MWHRIAEYVWMYNAQIVKKMHDAGNDFWAKLPNKIRIQNLYRFFDICTQSTDFDYKWLDMTFFFALPLRPEHYRFLATRSWSHYE